MTENSSQQGNAMWQPLNSGTFKRWSPLSNTEAVEALIKQAVEACWDITPEDRRSTETLQVEMMRLTSQAVSEFLEQKK